MVFPPKGENVHLDAVEDNVALIYPIESHWHWFAAFCVAKNGTITGDLIFSGACRNLILGESELYTLLAFIFKLL